MKGNKTNRHRVRRKEELNPAQRLLAREVFGDDYDLESNVFDAMARAAKDSIVYLGNMKTNVSHWSGYAMEYYGMPGEYMVDAGAIWLTRIHPDDRAAYLNDIDAVFRGDKDEHNMEYRAMNVEGNYVICNCIGTVIRDVDGNPAYFAGTITNKGALTNVDGVTNLYNVYELLNYLRGLYEKREQIDILVAGINDFQDLNSFYGYEKGNAILRTFAGKLLELKSSNMRVFRLSGVKFAVVLKECSKAEVEELWEKICHTANQGIPLDDGKVCFYCTGLNLHLDQLDIDGATVLSELKYLYDKSKRGNDGHLLFVDDGEGGDVRRKVSLLGAVKQSVMNGYKGFFLQYQPQLDGNGRVLGAEALLRWQNEEWGVVPPNYYITALENDVSFYGLGLWILRQAMVECKPLLEKHPRFIVSVNVSYKQLENVCFCDDVLGVVREVGFPPQNLVLEFTEHCHVINRENMMRQIRFFHEHGIYVAVDDFGTGYSNLLLVRDLAVDIVKIDQNFIRNITENSSDEIIVRYTIQCMKQLGIRVCIEGVETERVMGLLGKLGADAYQGYLFSRPTSLDNVRKMLETGL